MQHLMSNPYQSPELLPEGDDDQPLPGGGAMVRQVQIVAILMFVQAGLEAFMGLLFCGMAPFMYFMFQQMEEFQREPEMVTFTWGPTGYYIFAGVSCLTAAVIKTVAGIINLKYRGRVLGIVALISGFMSFPTFYCAPTAIALMIYGLIVYLNSHVALAFRMGKQGYTSRQIQGAFER